jgi:hypothetical protein
MSVMNQRFALNESELHKCFFELLVIERKLYIYSSLFSKLFESNISIAMAIINENVAE